MKLCNISSKNKLYVLLPLIPLQCYDIYSLIKNPFQYYESFKEKKLYVATCIHGTDFFIKSLSQGSNTKTIGVEGFPGGGKTCCILFILIYSFSYLLKVTSTAMVWNQDLWLGEIHVHQLFLILIEDNLTTHQQVELSVLKLLKNPNEMDFSLSMYVLLFYAMGQVSEEFLTIFDIILW